MRLKIILTYFYFIVFGLCSAALFGFMIYVLIRQANAPDNPFYRMYGPSLIENLNPFGLAMGFGLSVLGIGASVAGAIGMRTDKLWARILTAVMILGSMAVLVWAWGEIKAIEGVYFSNSPYRRMFMYGATPLVLATFLLPIGLAAGKRAAKKQA